MRTQPVAVGVDVENSGRMRAVQGRELKGLRDPQGQGEGGVWDDFSFLASLTDGYGSFINQESTFKISFNLLNNKIADYY